MFNQQEIGDSQLRDIMSNGAQHADADYAESVSWREGRELGKNAHNHGAGNRPERLIIKVGVRKVPSINELTSVLSTATSMALLKPSSSRVSMVIILARPTLTRESAGE